MYMYAHFHSPPSPDFPAVKVVAECLALSSSEETQDLARELLYQLFTVSTFSSQHGPIIPPASVCRYLTASAARLRETLTTRVRCTRP